MVADLGMYVFVNVKNIKNHSDFLRDDGGRLEACLAPNVSLDSGDPGHALTGLEQVRNLATDDRSAGRFSFSRVFFWFWFWFLFLFWF